MVINAEMRHKTPTNRQRRWSPGRFLGHEHLTKTFTPPHSCIDIQLVCQLSAGRASSLTLRCVAKIIVSSIYYVSFCRCRLTQILLASNKKIQLVDAVEGHTDKNLKKRDLAANLFITAHMYAQQKGQLLTLLYIMVFDQK